jgi:type IV pilus assembly protein PilW
MKTSPLHRSRGISLIELMVAMTIGLLILLVVTQAYLSGLTTQRTQTDTGRAQESGRFAFELLARSIRKSGYRNPIAIGQQFCDGTDPTPPTTPRLVLFNDPSTVNLTSSSSATIANLSDVIRVRYFGEGAIGGAADGTMVDCLGNSIPANTLEEDTLYVANDPNNPVNPNEPTLYCYASNAAMALPLIPGVESLQLLYGEDTDGDGNINRYVTAANVTNPNHIRSVMVSVITRTAGTANAVNLAQQTFNHFGIDYAPGGTAPSGDAGSVFSTPSPSDGRTRQHSTTVIALRNLCPT